MFVSSLEARLFSPAKARIAVLAILVSSSLAAGGCEGEGALTPAPADDPTSEATSQIVSEVRRLSDMERIRSVIDCYGLGHDLIFNHLGGDHSDALEALRRCNADDLITNVYLFDESATAARLASLEEFVGFVDQFAAQQGYSSARNVPGNLRIEMTGPSSAKVWSSTAAPHFLTAGPAGDSDRPTVDIVSARYVDTMVREPDGTWRTVERDLIVQQIWRGEGAYPFAQ